MLWARMLRADEATARRGHGFGDAGGGARSSRAATKGASSSSVIDKER